MNLFLKASLHIAGLFLFSELSYACSFYKLNSGGLKVECSSYLSNEYVEQVHVKINAKIARQIKRLNNKIGNASIFPLEIFIFPMNYLNNVKANAFFNKGRIYILSNKINELDFSEDTLFHELVHLLIFRLSKGNTPTWLDEGLALYLENNNNLSSRQIGYKCKINNSTGNPLTFCDPRLFYSISEQHVSYLVGQHGLRKILNFISILAQNNQFDVIFKDYFGREFSAINL